MRAGNEGNVGISTLLFAMLFASLLAVLQGAPQLLFFRCPPGLHHIGYWMQSLYITDYISLLDL